MPMPSQGNTTCQLCRKSDWKYGTQLQTSCSFRTCSLHLVLWTAQVWHILVALSATMEHLLVSCIPMYQGDINQEAPTTIKLTWSQITTTSKTAFTQITMCTAYHPLNKASILITSNIFLLLKMKQTSNYVEKKLASQNQAFSVGYFQTEWSRSLAALHLILCISSHSTSLIY